MCRSKNVRYDESGVLDSVKGSCAFDEGLDGLSGMLQHDRVERVERYIDSVLEICLPAKILILLHLVDGHFVGHVDDGADDGPEGGDECLPVLGAQPRLQEVRGGRVVVVKLQTLRSPLRLVEALLEGAYQGRRRRHGLPVQHVLGVAGRLEHIVDVVELPSEVELRHVVFHDVLFDSGLQGLDGVWLGHDVLVQKNPGSWET